MKPLELLKEILPHLPRAISIGSHALFGAAVAAGNDSNLAQGATNAVILESLAHNMGQGIGAPPLLAAYGWMAYDGADFGKLWKRITSAINFRIPPPWTKEGSTVSTFEEDKVGLGNGAYWPQPEVPAPLNGAQIDPPYTGPVPIGGIRR
jgi:hypothetical protein